MSLEPVILVENDPFPRIVQVILDPNVDPARVEAFARFFSHDLPDFAGWLARLRSRLTGLHPARVILADDEEAFRAAAPEADLMLVESFVVDNDVIGRAPRLKAIQKFGTLTGNIDSVACGARGIKVLTHRRRANMACAEHTWGLLLALTHKICETAGLMSVRRLKEAGYDPSWFDRKHTSNSNWARVTGMQSVHGRRLGIIGMGEIGREVAARAAGFSVEVVYTQRRQLPAEVEKQYGVRYLPFDELLATSDFVSVHTPGNAQTTGLIGEREMARMKRGALLFNISRAEIVQRAPLLAALASGHLGGYATDTPFDEPGADHDPLLSMPNVILTPHVAAQPRFNALGDFEDMIVGMDRTWNSVRQARSTGRSA